MLKFPLATVCLIWCAFFLTLATSRPCMADVTPPNKLAQSNLRSPGESGQVVVACVGDSITAGVGASSSATNYPSLLTYLLGMGFNVENFGESGATLLKNGDSPYWKRGSFKNVAGANANVVVIMLGSNDSKPWNWTTHKSEFVSDYTDFINYFATMPTHPRIFLCSPPPVPGSGNYGINEPVVEEQAALIKQLAADKKLTFIDVHSVVPDNSKYFADNVHPNDAGYVYLASAIYMGLTNSPAIMPIANTTYSGPISVTILPPAPGLTVRYTTDGSDPGRKSTEYTAPFTVTAPVTVKAQAFDGHKWYGLITSTTYAAPTQ